MRTTLCLFNRLTTECTSFSLGCSSNHPFNIKFKHVHTVQSWDNYCWTGCWKSIIFMKIMSASFMHISVSDPFYFDTDPNPRIRFRWLRIRIQGNFNSVNFVFHIKWFAMFFHINYIYYIIRNVTKNRFFFSLCK